MLWLINGLKKDTVRKEQYSVNETSKSQRPRIYQSRMQTLSTRTIISPFLHHGFMARPGRHRTWTISGMLNLANALLYTSSESVDDYYNGMSKGSETLRRTHDFHFDTHMQLHPVQILPRLAPFKAGLWYGPR